MKGLIWEDPPSAHHRSTMSRWAILAGELRKHPGKWARVPLHDPGVNVGGVAQTLRARWHLDAVSRTVNGQGRVYARWPADVEPDE